MTTPHGASATIYQFPARGRFAVRSEQSKSADDHGSRVATTACGSAWYHEEAIRNSQNAGDE